MDSETFRKYQLAKAKADASKKQQNPTEITRPESHETFFHSNAYSAVQNNQPNSTRTTSFSFNERQKLDKNRTYIQKYNQNSDLAQGARSAIHSTPIAPHPKLPTKK